MCEPAEVQQLAASHGYRFNLVFQHKYGSVITMMFITGHDLSLALYHAAVAKALADFANAEEVPLINVEEAPLINVEEAPVQTQQVDPFHGRVLPDFNKNGRAYVRYFFNAAFPRVPLLLYGDQEITEATFEKYSPYTQQSVICDNMRRLGLF